MQAQLSYRNSLSVCDKLHDIVPDKELLEMRARLFLNLGLVYESREYSMAQKFIEKAVSIARYLVYKNYSDLLIVALLPIISVKLYCITIAQLLSFNVQHTNTLRE